MHNYVGKEIDRVDAVDKATGMAVFTADIALPRMLHMKVLRSGRPHALITSIDTSAAESMDGVKKVVTGSSCDILFGTCLWDQPPLANGKVRHAGEPVAAVIAETPWQAAEALKQIKVTYEDLPYVLDPIEAAKQDAPLIHEKNGEYRHISYVVHPIKGSNIFHHYKLRKGDIKKGFVDVDVIVEDDFEFPLSSHTALEPHAAICRFHHDGSIEMWASNQAPFVLRDVLSDMFKVPASKVRVHIPYLGGGFGGKSDVSIEPLVAYAASFVPGYAVKLVLTRQEVITGSLLGRGMKGHMRLGAKSDGTLVALEASMYFADGAYGDTSWAIDTVAGHNCTGPFEIPNCHVDVYGVYTNSPSVGAYRGYGHPEGHLMVNRLMDRLARKLNIPLPEIMKKNFLKEGKVNALGQRITKHHGDIFKCLDAVYGSIFTENVPREDDEYFYGRGLAAMMKSPKMSTNAASTCYLQMNVDGSIFINLSGIEMGQGVHTVFSQIAAEAMNIPVCKIKVYKDVDTQFSPWEWQTVASMQTYRGGRAIQDACHKAIELLKHNASLVFHSDISHVDYDGQYCIHKLTGERIPIGSLARGYSYENGLTVGIPVQTTGYYRVADLTEPDPETGMGNAAGSWTFGCQAALIRIAKATGKVDILHFASAFDIGKAINPKTARGQVVGGVVQGLGATLMEKISFKEDGNIKNVNFPAYAVPRIKDIPHKQTVFLFETPNNEGPWSAKPMAEHPIVAVAPCILNAIYDAIGVEFTRLPVLPSDILGSIDRKE